MLLKDVNIFYFACDLSNYISNSNLNDILNTLSIYILKLRINIGSDERQRPNSICLSQNSKVIIYCTRVEYFSPVSSQALTV